MLIKNSIKFLFLSIAFVLFSCGTEEEIVPDTLTISADLGQVYVGNVITFSAVSQNEGTVTNEAQFFVNGTEITGNTFTPTEESANNTAYAIYNGTTSNTISFTSVVEVILPDTYSKKVLAEDYTGTWCGYCPGMQNVLNHFTNYSNNVIPVAIHCGDDPFQFEFQTQLQNAYNATGLPQGRINRINTLDLFVENYIIDYCGTNQTYYEEFIQPYLDQQAPLGLAIDSELNGNTINFEVKVGFLVNQIPNAKLVVYLLEDGLVYEQTNYFAGTGNSACNYSSYPDHINDYVHNHVLRKCYTDIFGDEIPADQIVADDVYTRSFSVAIPSAVESTEHLSLVAFVMGNDNNEVINAQYVHVGESQNFD